MHKTLLYAAYGYLLVTGVLHYLIDVVAQYARKHRAPSATTTMYWGLHSAYSLGQVVFALTALLLVHGGSPLFSQRSGQALSIIAVVGWLLICFAFVEYIPPRINMAIVLVLLIAAALTSSG